MGVDDVNIHLSDTINQTKGETMNNHQKWQARKNEIKTTCGTMTQQEIINWFNEDTDDTCTRIAVYQYLFENFDHPFN